MHMVAHGVQTYLHNKVHAVAKRLGMHLLTLDNYKTCKPYALQCLFVYLPSLVPRPSHVFQRMQQKETGIIICTLLHLSTIKHVSLTLLCTYLALYPGLPMFFNACEKNREGLVNFVM